MFEHTWTQFLGMIRSLGELLFLDLVLYCDIDIVLRRLRFSLEQICLSACLHFTYLCLSVCLSYLSSFIYQSSSIYLSPVFFSCYCAKISWHNQPKEERVYFWITIWCHSPSWWGRHGRSRKHLSHDTFCQEAERLKVCSFSFYSVQAPSLDCGIVLPVVKVNLLISVTVI